jgi:hypothetical protein
MEQVGSFRTDFHEIWYLCIFRKSVEKIQVSLKSDKNNGTLHEDLCTFMMISRWILLRMRNVVENTKTHVLCSINFSPRKSCRLWDNVEECCRARQVTDDSIIRRMRLACWITKATDTHWEYVTLIAFPRQQWLREHASVLRYTYVVSFVSLLKSVGTGSRAHTLSYPVDTERSGTVSEAWRCQPPQSSAQVRNTERYLPFLMSSRRDT